MSKRKHVIRIASIGVAFMLVFAGNCYYQPPPNDTTLGVPFRTQPQWDYCGTASVLMWRLKNGYSEVSQSTIYNWMGGAGAGVSAQPIAQAVAYWAGVNDATVDWGAKDRE